MLLWHAIIADGTHSEDQIHGGIHYCLLQLHLLPGEGVRATGARMSSGRAGSAYCLARPTCSAQCSDVYTRVLRSSRELPCRGQHGSAEVTWTRHSDCATAVDQLAIGIGDGHLPHLASSNSNTIAGELFPLTTNAPDSQWRAPPAKEILSAVRFAAVMRGGPNSDWLVLSK